MRKVAVVGVGHSNFGVRKDVNIAELTWEAVKEALEDAGLTQKDIDYVPVGSYGFWYEEPLPAVVVTEYCGLVPKGHVHCESACATGSAAVHLAYYRVASGLSDIAMAIGFEKMTEVDTPTAVEFIGRAGSYIWEFENFGMTFPGYYALLATNHMANFGTKEEHMAMVAVKNHYYGARNEKAYLRREIKVEDVLNSRPVAWPIKFFDCCPINDGAAAVILAAEEVAKKITDTPIWIKGVGCAGDTGNIAKRENLFSIRSAQLASRQAYEMAKITPQDVDVAEVHDCFTIAEILAYEDLGFCKKGEGPKLIEEGQTYVGGKIPVNVDGGLKAKGHPIGATGCSMIYELTRQLRQEVEPERQADIKKGIALAHNVGGTGHSCYVTILGRD